MGRLLAKRFAWTCLALFAAALLSLQAVDESRHPGPSRPPKGRAMSEPCLFVIGATHHNAPLEVREKLAVESEAGLRADLASGRRPARARGPQHLQPRRVLRRRLRRAPRRPVQAAYCARQKFEVGRVREDPDPLTGRDAALHLFEVASGLDSQLVGENEIFGQVKDAYAAAQASGTTGAVLNRVFQKAFQAAKHVRTHTGISSGTVSVANVAVDLATNIFGSLAERQGPGPRDRRDRRGTARPSRAAAPRTWPSPAGRGERARGRRGPRRRHRAL
jgi:hypothetical protein